MVGAGARVVRFEAEISVIFVHVDVHEFAPNISPLGEYVNTLERRAASNVVPHPLRACDATLEQSSARAVRQTVKTNGILIESRQLDRIGPNGSWGPPAAAGWPASPRGPHFRWVGVPGRTASGRVPGRGTS